MLGLKISPQENPFQIRQKILKAVLSLMFLFWEIWADYWSTDADGGVVDGVFLKVIVKMMLLLVRAGVWLGGVIKITPIHILIWKCSRLMSRQRYILLQDQGNKIPLEIKKKSGNLEIKQQQSS